MAQGDRCARDQPADEPTARLVVARGEQVDGPDDDGAEDEANRDVDIDDSLGAVHGVPSGCLGSGGPTPSAAADAGKGHRTDRCRGQHGDLGQRVQATDVDQDDVHHVATVAFGHRALDDLASRSAGRCARLAP